MIPPPRLGRRGPEVLRSQLALEVALVAYAAIAALLLLRVVFKAVEISPLVWAGSAVFALSDPLLIPLGFFAPARFPLLGDATLGDITLLGLLVLVPLALASQDRPS